MITKEEAIEMLEKLEDCIIKAKTYSAIERSQMFEQIKEKLQSQQDKLDKIEEITYKKSEGYSNSSDCRFPNQRLHKIKSILKDDKQ